MTFGFDPSPVTYAGLGYLPDGREGWAGALSPVAELADPGRGHDVAPNEQRRMMFRPTEYSQLYDGPPLPEFMLADPRQFGGLSLTLLLTNITVDPVDHRTSWLGADVVRPLPVAARVRAAERHVNISTGLPFHVLELEFSDGAVVAACAPDPGAAEGTASPAADPYPVGSVIRALGVLTGRFTRVERRSPAEDVLPVAGPCDAVVADVATCLGLGADPDDGTWGLIFDGPQGTWDSREALVRSDGLEVNDAREAVGHAAHVARIGVDGVGVSRDLPGTEWIGFVSEVDELGVPVDDIGVVHVAATELLVMPDVESMEEEWGIDIDPDGTSGWTPREETTAPEPEDPEDPLMRNQLSFFDVLEETGAEDAAQWAAPEPQREEPDAGDEDPVLLHVDEDGRQVNLAGYGERLKVSGVLRETGLWTSSLGDPDGAQHIVADLRLGDREVVVHFPMSAEELVDDGAVVHGYVTVCSLRVSEVNLATRFVRPGGADTRPWTEERPDLPPQPHPARGDAMMSMAMMCPGGFPVTLPEIADAFHVSLPVAYAEMKRAAAVMNVDLEVGGEYFVDPVVNAWAPARGMPRMPLTTETAQLIYRAVRFTYQHCAAEDEDGFHRLQEALEQFLPQAVIADAPDVGVWEPEAAADEFDDVDDDVEEGFEDELEDAGDGSGPWLEDGYLPDSEAWSPAEEPWDGAEPLWDGPESLWGGSRADGTPEGRGRQP